MFICRHTHIIVFHGYVMYCIAVQILRYFAFLINGKTFRRFDTKGCVYHLLCYNYGWWWCQTCWMHQSYANFGRSFWHQISPKICHSSILKHYNKLLFRSNNFVWSSGMFKASTKGDACNPSIVKISMSKQIDFFHESPQKWKSPQNVKPSNRFSWGYCR